MSENEDPNSAAAILKRAVARVKADELRDDPPLPGGLIAVVVEKAWVPGAGEIELPMVLIQDGERTFHIPDGRELAMLAETSPRIARWAVSPRLED
jgi:hypothetical protein